MNRPFDEMLIKLCQCTAKQNLVCNFFFVKECISNRTVLGAQNLIELRLIETLFNKLVTELDEIKELILNTIHFCLMVDVEQALAVDATSTLTSLLDHPTDKIKILAALTIFHLRLQKNNREKS